MVELFCVGYLMQFDQCQKKNEKSEGLVSAELHTTTP